MTDKVQGAKVEVRCEQIWIVNGNDSFRLAYEAESDAAAKWYADRLRAALKAQPAPTEAPNFEEALQVFKEELQASQVSMDPELSKVISENRWNLYEGDDEAPTEAQGGKLLELFKLTLGTLGLHDIAEARRIGALYRDAQSSGNTGELVQGEDSARLEFGEITSIVHADRGAKHILTVYFKTNAGRDEFRDVFGDMVLKDRARASAETGGVKP